MLKRGSSLRNTASFYVCPVCSRAVPASAGEQFCSNDGSPLLKGCPACQQPIRSPYALFCGGCGAALPRRSPSAGQVR